MAPFEVPTLTKVSLTEPGQRKYPSIAPPPDRYLARWCVWLVGRDGAAGLVLEDGLCAGAAGVDVVAVDACVVVGAEQDEVVEFGDAAVCFVCEVVGCEFVASGAAGVLAVAACALVERAHLRVGSTASDARVHEVATLELDGHAACVAGQSFGGFGADRACAFEYGRLI